MAVDHASVVTRYQPNLDRTTSFCSKGQVTVNLGKRGYGPTSCKIGESSGIGTCCMGGVDSRAVIGRYGIAGRRVLFPLFIHQVRSHKTVDVGGRGRLRNI